MDLNVKETAVLHDLIQRKTYVALFWDVMNYQLFEIDGHAFTLSKFMIGIALLILGYAISSRAAKYLERRLFMRMQIEESLRYTLSQFAFYLFLIVTSLFTLRVLNVPITIFAVVGGAVAIGIGFGSQNIISNFISSLIVMIERPIRLGDFIEIDSFAGTVEKIGIRSTTLITGSNARLIVPNAKFLEKPLLNWTLSDRFQWASVKVGVAYGSDITKIETIAIEAIKDIADVDQALGSSVRFVDFGDNAMIFTIGCSCRASTSSDRVRVESSLRFALERLFREHGISMPFPQREIRLTEPVEVKIQS
jgi:potassium-dependent mechanosensitive channel